MSLKDKINHHLPMLDAVSITEKPAADKKRSIWLAVSQLALNLPRLIVGSLIKLTFVFVQFNLIFLIAVLGELILRPLSVIYTFIRYGGHFVDADGADETGVKASEVEMVQYGFVKALSVASGFSFPRRTITFKSKEQSNEG